MSEAEIILQPWDNYPRPFTVVQNGTTIYRGETSSIKIPVSGQIEVYWAGYFHPNGTQIGADSYSFSTENCKEGEQINFNYRKTDSSKPDSVVAFCNQPQPQPQPTILTQPPTTQPTIQITTTTTQPFQPPILPETGTNIFPLFSVGIICCAVGLFLSRKFKK